MQTSSITYLEGARPPPDLLGILFYFKMGKKSISSGRNEQVRPSTVILENTHYACAKCAFFNAETVTFDIIEHVRFVVVIWQSVRFCEIIASQRIVCSNCT